jgi:phosphate acetyltransferase
VDETPSLSPRFAAILEQARGLPALPVAVVDAHEPHVLAGVVESSQHGLTEPVLLGQRARIESLAALAQSVSAVDS